MHARSFSTVLDNAVKLAERSGYVQAADATLATIQPLSMIVRAAKSTDSKLTDLTDDQLIILASRVGEAWFRGFAEHLADSRPSQRSIRLVTATASSNVEES